MKRRDAMKRAAAALLGAVAAPLVVAKVIEPSWDDKMAAAVDACDWKPPEIKEGDKIFITHTYQLKSRPHAVLSDYR